MLPGFRQRAPRETVPYGQPCRVGYLIVLDFSLSHEGHDATKPKLNSLCGIALGARVCAAVVHRAVVYASRCSSCYVPCVGVVCAYTVGTMLA